MHKMNWKNFKNYKYRIILSLVFAILWLILLLADWWYFRTKASFVMYGFLFVLAMYAFGWVLDSEWASKKSGLKRGVAIGTLIGLLKIPFFLVFGERLTGMTEVLWAIPDALLCSLLNLSVGEPCGWFVVIYGWIYNPIFFGIVGGIVGYLYDLVKRK